MTDTRTLGRYLNFQLYQTQFKWHTRAPFISSVTKRARDVKSMANFEKYRHQKTVSQFFGDTLYTTLVPSCDSAGVGDSLVSMI